MNNRVTTSSQSGCFSTLIFILVGGIIFSLVGEFSSEDKAESKILSSVMLVIFGIIGFIVRNAISENIRENTEKANDLLKNDSRPPVLYLRSFESDHDTHDDYNINESISSINPYYFLRKAIYPHPTFEQQLAYIINQVGPFIGLTAPESFGVTLGAYKLETITEDWQKEVNDYIDKCSLIIIRVGDSKGLQWEIEQIAKKGLLDKLIIFIQFPGPQDKELINARFRKFDELFSRLTKVNIFGNLDKNRYVFFRNGKPNFAINLTQALNEMEFNVEESAFRGRMKGMYPGADNSMRKPFKFFETGPGLIGLSLFALLSMAVFSIAYFIIAIIVSEWENCPGTILLALNFIAGIFSGIATSRISVLLNIAAGKLHTLWGCVLSLLSFCVFYSVLWGTWDFFGVLGLINESDFEIFLSLFVGFLPLIWIPLVCYIYGWSKAEKELSRQHV